jgi:hypothetical protein
MKRFFEKIAHTIIPHKKNGNIPHILKGEFVLVLVIFVGVLFYFNQNNLNIVGRLNLTATVYPAVLADLTNQDRATSGVNKLTWSKTLEKAAKMKAEDMLKNGYFAHTSPAGVTPWHWFKEVNYNFIYAGENLAVDFTESQNVENAWLNSPKHKENIVNSNFTEIGIATAEGFFEGKNTTFVVELFGSPSKIQSKEKPPVKSNSIVKQIDKVVIPTVAGASASNLKEDGIKIIEESDKLIVAKNENSLDDAVPTSNNLNNKPISTWYERFIIQPTNIIVIIYKIILGLVLVSTLLLLTKKYQKHHTKHIVMGVILTILITILLLVISIK